MSNQLKALLASYARSVFAGATTLYLAGITDPKDLVWSLAAALAPVALRYANPNDPAFGKLPTAKEVEVAAKTAKPKKAVTKANVDRTKLK